MQRLLRNLRNSETETEREREKRRETSHQITQKSSLSSSIPSVVFMSLPCSKNSDLRFKFFKDKGSDSTWEMGNRTQWGTAGEPWGDLHFINNHTCIVYAAYVKVKVYKVEMWIFLFLRPQTKSTNWPPRWCVFYSVQKQSLESDSWPFRLRALLFTFVPHGHRLLLETSINSVWSHFLQGDVAGCTLIKKVPGQGTIRE